MPAIGIDLFTYSDADFCQAFKLNIGTESDGTTPNYCDFTGKRLIMKVRRQPADVEVFVSLTSDPGDGIDIYAEEGISEENVFAVFIPMAQLQELVPGDYVHSLVIEHENAMREEIFNGALHHAIGVSR